MKVFVYKELAINVYYLRTDIIPSVDRRRKRAHHASFPE